MALVLAILRRVVEFIRTRIEKSLLVPDNVHARERLRAFNPANADATRSRAQTRKTKAPVVGPVTRELVSNDADDRLARSRSADDADNWVIGMRGKITKRAVDALGVDAKSEQTLWDTEVRGFGLRVRVSGAKIYIVRYRAGTGGRASPLRTVTMGRHGSPWTPDGARSEAKRLLG